MKALGFVFVVGLLSLLVCGVPVLGDTHTWTGTDSESYVDPDNWSPSGPPAQFDWILVDDPSLHDTCNLDAASNVTLTR